jgi:hypothetical protein
MTSEQKVVLKKNSPQMNTGKHRRNQKAQVKRLSETKIQKD